MNFHFLINSRGRPFLLSQSLESIFQNAKNPDDIYVSVRYDIDDPLTVRFVSSNERKWKNVTWVSGERPINLHNSFNVMAKTSLASNMWPWNDDAMMLTLNYDEIILNKIREFNKDIYLCNTDDDSIDRDRSKGYSAFPVISRKGVEVLGYVMLEPFVGLGGDSSIFRIYKAIDRIIDCSDVKVGHILHRDIYTINNPDSTAAEMRAKTSRNFIDPYTCNLDEEIEKITRYLNE